MIYQDFLASKRRVFGGHGIDHPPALPSQLYPWQSAIVRWALRKGRAAIFADCGLGKTLMQLAWAHAIAAYTGRPVLILAPLAVSGQTAHEGEQFGLPVTVCQDAADVREGVNITNYERLHRFHAGAFGGLVLDESSILKAFGGELRKQITDFARTIPFRLACTATPAPNDLIELTNHAEFLNVLTGKEIIALFFVQDGNTTHEWRLRAHAHEPFYAWLASWAVAIRKPSDLGVAYDDGPFLLPPLHVHHVAVDDVSGLSTRLFASDSLTLEERRAARRGSLLPRVQQCAALVALEQAEPWIVWCDLNAESQALAKAIPGAVEVTGSDDPDVKVERLTAFAEGRIRVLVTKPSIAGWGMNWQHCARVAFVGLSDSWEQYYQSIRRVWRFGQVRPVECYIIASETEGAVVRNIERKEAAAAELMQGLVAAVQVHQDVTKTESQTMTSVPSGTHRGDGWEVKVGDCIDLVDSVPDRSVGLSVFSPPFPGMYAYSNHECDMGNTDGVDAMIEHFRFLVKPEKLRRVMMPGRLCCVHLMQLTAMQSRDGYIGVKDYRGRTIEMFQQEGWIYAGEVTIDKNPQIQATRNKERGLLFKTLATDSSLMRMALADYLLYFRAPGQNISPIRAGQSQKYNPSAGWITEEEWIEWAAPVWYRQTRHYPGGIRETDVLNVAAAKSTDDERHLCPLQLGVIERAVKLWSAPGELVLSPFAGIGSEGYEAVRLGRRFLGFELKPSYAEVAAKNLRAAEHAKAQVGLFDEATA